MRFLLPAAAVLLATAVPAGAQVAQGNDNALVVSGVQVDVGGKGAAAARQSGWRAAQRLAWPSLWSRLTGRPAAQAPRLGDSTLDTIVSAIEVEQEQASASRYIARLAVVFDRARTAEYVGDAEGLTRSPPFLVIPLLQDAGTRFGLVESSPWRQAWSRLRGSESPVDYVRIQPSPADAIWLSAWSAQRRDEEWWRSVAARYQVADVLMPEVILERTYAGGPVSATLIAREGTRGTELGRARLVNRAGDVNGLLDAAVREADAIYAAALRDGRLRADPALLEPEVTLVGDLSTGILQSFAPEDSIEFRLATPDEAAWTRTESFLRGLPGVTGVRLVQLGVGGESVARVLGVGLDALRYALDQRGQTLAEDAQGLLLRPRRPEDPRVEPPVVAEEPADGVAPGAAPTAPAPAPAGGAAPPAAPLPSGAAAPVAAPPVAEPAPPPPPPANAPRQLLPPGG